MIDLFLIGGAPLTGKTTLINRLNGYTNFSTDDIGLYLQKVMKKEDNNDLFYDHGLNAITFYEKYKDAKTIFEYETKKANAIQIGVDALIDVDFGFEKLAIEGIAITPKYVRKLLNQKKVKVKYIFLYDVDRNRIKERLYKRGLYDDAKNYPDWIKEIELEWVIMYNMYYKSECKKYNLQIHNIDDIENLI